MTIAATFMVTLADLPAFAQDPPQPDETSRQFQSQILPVLQQYCSDCHAGDAGDAGDKAQFLSATTLDQMLSSPASWRNAASQLANRTMPPVDEPQPDEADRLRVSAWIDDTLRANACKGEAYAGTVTTRRLNRREYANTIRDLVGVEMDFAATLPVDSGGGEGFDNNGETLFLPPLLLERYLEAAQRIVDEVIVPPPMSVLYRPGDMHPELPDPNLDKGPNAGRTIPAGERVTVLVPIPVEGDYRIPVGIVPLDDGALTVQVEVDDIAAAKMTYRRYGKEGVANQEETRLRLTRGLHAISIRAPADHDVTIVRLRVERIPAETTPVQVARHMQLLGVKPGEVPTNTSMAARRTIRRFATSAFRRPVSDTEMERLYALYENAEQRGDSYEERIKLVMKAVLVSPDFLFRIEAPPQGPAIEPVTDFELATRLSYLFWSTMPDQELLVLAKLGQLNSEQTLKAQVYRMLDDPRSKTFFETFVGQWLGTRDVGGRRAATENAIQNEYTPFIAADMRQQAVLLFENIVREDRSLLELLDSDYTYLTGKLAKFLSIPVSQPLPRDEFQRVKLPDGRHGGVLGLGGVLALTSHISERQASPVLRGAWVLDTLLGTRIPTPPDDVPALDKKKRRARKLTLRETLELHRENEACAACHNLMDPIGFGLENFDFLGRWRDEDNGKPIDATGQLPTGERFSGPAELKKLMLKRKDEFARQLIRKMLGYALGRSLVDADECTIEQLMRQLEAQDYRGRTLLTSVILSTPFRNKNQPQGHAEP